jgi:DNA-directed RNA polymerase specialized sigma24 family protein
MQDFAAYELPRALGSYRPDRGPLEPWLAVVFRNYALGRRLRLARERAQWESLEGIPEPTAPQAEFSDAELSGVAAAVGQASGEQRRALRAYFGAQGSLRAAAQALGWSRHKTRKVLAEGIAATAARLRLGGIIDDEELEICRQRFVEGLSWGEISLSRQISEPQARARVTRALARLFNSFSHP